MEPTPGGTTIGRTVYFVLSNGELRPATIVVVRRDDVQLNVNVAANDPWGEDFVSSNVMSTSARYNGSQNVPHTWHWPDRV